jgi:carboxylesterase
MNSLDEARAVLLIHGLGGTDADLGPLRKLLQRAGFETEAVMLPGHGTHPRDLIGVTAADWLESVRCAYRRLLAGHATVHVVGMCMGGLLAAEICKREDHRRGKLAVLAAPVFLDGWSTPWYRGLRTLIYPFPRLAARIRIHEEEPYGIKNDLTRAMVRARFARGDSFHYRWVPLLALREVDILREQLGQGLERLDCQTLILHAHEDELTSVRSATWLHRHIPNSTLELLRDSYHMICIDNERHAVAARLLQFLGAHPACAIEALRQRGGP